MEDTLTGNFTEVAFRFLEAAIESNDVISIPMTTDQKLARLGELTSIVTMISPFPAFVSCGKSSIDQDRIM